MASARKRFSVVQVLQQLSDDEYFDDTDSDRDSLYQLGDVERFFGWRHVFIQWAYSASHVLLSGESQTAPHYCINFN